MLDGRRGSLLADPQQHTFDDKEYVYPLISTILLNRAIRQATIADKWLRFASTLSYVVVGAMVLILLGGILWSLVLMLVAPTYMQLHLLLGMGVAVIVAVHTLFSRSRNNGQPRPHDDFPYDDVASSSIDED